MYFRCVEMMVIVVYEYLLTPLIFSPHVETLFIDHIIINYPLLGFGNCVRNCICVGSGCLILQTLQKPSV